MRRRISAEERRHDRRDVWETRLVVKAEWTLHLEELLAMDKDGGQDVDGGVDG